LASIEDMKTRTLFNSFEKWVSHNLLPISYEFLRVWRGGGGSFKH